MALGGMRAVAQVLFAAGRPAHPRGRVSPVSHRLRDWEPHGLPGRAGQGLALAALLRLGPALLAAGALRRLALAGASGGGASRPGAPASSAVLPALAPAGAVGAGARRPWLLPRGDGGPGAERR